VRGRSRDNAPEVSRGLVGRALPGKSLGEYSGRTAKSLNEIATILGAMGLSLGMRLDPEELERRRAQSERAGEA